MLSQWTWLNPLPNGKGIDDIHFFNNEEGIAVGEQWNCVSTSDGGHTWRVLANPDEFEMYTAQYPSQTTGFAHVGWREDMFCSGPILLAATTDGGVNWNTLNMVHTDGYVVSYSFSDQLNGLAFERDGSCDLTRGYHFSRTSDGGQSWLAITDSQDVWPRSMVSYDSLVSVVIHDFPVSPLQPMIMKTTDGGYSWEAKHLIEFDIVYRLARFGARSCLAMGPHGNILRSTDIGETWTNVSVGDEVNFKKLAATDTLTMYLLGTDANLRSYVYRSTNGGVGWELVYASDEYFRGIATRPDGEVWLSGDGGKLQRSRDLGISWDLPNSFMDVHLNKVQFSSKERGWIFGDTGYVARTTNSGETWETRPKPTSADIVECTFPRDDAGWIVDEWGRIFHTTDGGSSWLLQYASTKDTVRKIRHMDERVALAVGDLGMVLSTYDGGAEWEPSNAGIRPSAVCGDLDVWKDGTAFCAFDSLLYYSADSGKTWDDARTVPFYTRVLKIIRICHPTSERVFVFADNGGGSVNYRSTNRGITWTVMTYPPSTNSRTFRTYEFRNDLTGVGVGSLVCATTDGGVTWERDPSVRGNGVFLFPDGQGWIVGNRGGIIRSQLYTGIEPIYTIPEHVVLEQNYPNPFNPSTVIGYSMPVAGHVSLKVYDILGRVIATLTDGVESAGTRSLTWNTDGLASGIYFCRIEAAGTGHPPTYYTQTRKMLLIR
jgi:photosystem II stability/assembly factor-like uncharacterized protein